MINSLDKSNPAQLLLDSMAKSGMDMAGYTSFKDGEKFSLGTIKNGKVCSPVSSPRRQTRQYIQQLSQIYNITAGDPSRGNISLESQNAPAVGTQVQVPHLLRALLVLILTHMLSFFIGQNLALRSRNVFLRHRRRHWPSSHPPSPPESSMTARKPTRYRFCYPTPSLHPARMGLS